MGGGLAIIPFLKNMIDTYHWFTADDLTTLIALSEMTPGALGVNMATYAGFLTAGITGALVATLALVCPSVLIVSVFSKMWQKIKDDKRVLSIFNGVKGSVAGLITAIFLILFLPLLGSTLASLMTLKILVVFGVAISLLFTKKVPLIVYLLICGIMGILFF